MGSASCKSSKSSEQNQDKKDNKGVTIGVFGLNNAGKTSTVKALEGEPKKNVTPTIGSSSTTVANPILGKEGEKNSDSIKIIDVSGDKRFREQSWSQYYDQIHGLIFVIDANERQQMKENKDILDQLLTNPALKNKPILILANKQDLDGSIDEEDDVKRKLQIEKLKTKHKIEFCTALPQNKTKVDSSIRKGFSWLIQAIQEDYTQLNSRVNNAKNKKPAPKEVEKKNLTKPRPTRSDSDDSDSFYRKTRTQSPTTKRPTKLPNLNLSPTKPTTRNGHETYSEDDDDYARPGSRPNISRLDSEKMDSHRSSSQPASSTLAAGLGKKKKLVGTTPSTRDNINDVPTKKFGDTAPKSFRSSFETLPEESPWSLSASKTGKNDNLLPKSYLKPNDSMKRDRSPLVHDTRPPPVGTMSKSRNFSDDDDDDVSRGQKSKSNFPSTNRFNDDYSYSSPTKKSTSGIYGDDDDDEDKRKDFKKLQLPSTSKSIKSYNSDEDNKKNYPRSSDRFNATNDYPVKSTDSARLKYNQDNLSSPSTKPQTRLQLNNNDYPSTLSKPTPLSRLNDEKRPLSASKPAIRSKYNDDDDDDIKSSPLKSTVRSKSPGDDYESSLKPLPSSKFKDDYYSSSASKPPASSRFLDDYTSSTKPIARSKYDDNLDNRALSSPKIGDRLKPSGDYPSSSLSTPISRAKYGDIIRPSSPSIKPMGRSKFDDDDDDYNKVSSSTSKPIARSTFRDDDDDDDDDKYGSSSKPAVGRSNYNSKDLSTSPTKPSVRSKFDNDDYGTSSKPAARSKYDDDDHTSSTWKPTAARSKFDDDNIGSSSKVTTNNRDRSFPTVKPTSKSKFEDDDDDDDRSSSPRKPTSHSKFDDDPYGSSSKPTMGRSNFDSKDRSFPTSKPASKSKFEDDDDDDDRASPLRKTTSHSKFDDDDDYYRSSSKPAARSKFEDDDDYTPSSSKRNAGTDLAKLTASAKKIDSPSRYNDYGGSGGARSRDDFDSSKGGSSSARDISASNIRYRRNMDDDN